jgi:hypothetical protein
VAGSHRRVAPISGKTPFLLSAFLPLWRGSIRTCVICSRTDPEVVDSSSRRKGRFRPLHLAVKTGLVLSPISEVFRANADGAHGNRQTSGIQCRILLSSSWTVSHTIHPQDSALMHCCTTGTLLQLSLKSYHHVFRIMNSSSSVAKTWTLHSEKSGLPSEAHDASFGPDDTISRWCIGWRTNLEANTEVPSGPFEVLPVIHFSRFSKNFGRISRADWCRSAVQ